jgi:hypothetical protein
MPDQTTLADLVDLDAEGPWTRYVGRYGAFRAFRWGNRPPGNLFRQSDAGDRSMVERQLTPGFLST